MLSHCRVKNIRKTSKEKRQSSLGQMLPTKCCIRVSQISGPNQNYNWKTGIKEMFSDFCRYTP